VPQARSSGLLVYRAGPVTPRSFVSFWAGLYRDPQEPLYTENIGRSLAPDRVRSLFLWKNGGNLSTLKQQSVKENYVGRLAELRNLPSDTSAQDFLDRFSTGGAIWRIFWLHCWQPDRFPIYDQHVHRAMTFIQDRKKEEMRDWSDKRKIEAYLTRYLPFVRRFRTLGSRQVDRALWTFGQFIRRWSLIDSAT